MKLFLSIAMVAMAAPAVAAPAPEETPRVAVSYADLDLTTARGAAWLQRRIVAAATEVCGSGDIRDPAAWRIQQCRRAAIDAAAPKVALALADARGGRRLASLEMSRPALP